MKMIKIYVVFIVSFILLTSYDIPKGWLVAGSKPKSYEMGIDKGAGRNGGNAATIKSVDDNIDGFGTLMQNFLPGKYRGERIKLTGYIKSQNVDGWAGLWLRVDQEKSHKPLAFDNMGDRPVKGTTSWKKYEIVLDVPDNAVNIAYGALLAGTGQIWFTNLDFEIVDKATPKTDKINKVPTNLNFEE